MSVVNVLDKLAAGVVFCVVVAVMVILIYMAFSPAEDSKERPTVVDKQNIFKDKPIAKICGKTIVYKFGENDYRIMEGYYNSRKIVNLDTVC